MTFKEFIDLCGGEIEIARKINRHQLTVQRWEKISISAHNYQALIDNFPVTRKQIDSVNSYIKKAKQNG